MSNNNNNKEHQKIIVNQRTTNQSISLDQQPRQQSITVEQTPPEQDIIIDRKFGFYTGATFTPEVSKEGIISWTNDKNLDNPEPVNIKGEKGEPFTYQDFTEEQLESLKGKDGLTTSITQNGKVYTQVNGNITLPNNESTLIAEELEKKIKDLDEKKIEAISLSGIALPIINKSVDIPIANDQKPGLVLSSSVENSISIQGNGMMLVNNINVNRLVQTDGEWMELSCGDSSSHQRGK